MLPYAWAGLWARYTCRTKRQQRAIPPSSPYDAPLVCVETYAVLKERIRSGEALLRHIPDEHMPADFLTKWIAKDKLERSVRFATNSWGIDTPS